MGLTGIDIAEIIFIVTIFAVGVGSFVYLAVKDDDKDKCN